MRHRPGDSAGADAGGSNHLWATRGWTAAILAVGSRSDRPVSIVRPCCGIDNFCEDTLGSSFKLDYPSYEVIFCLASGDDPIAPLVRGAIEANPGRPARLLIGDERISALIERPGDATRRLRGQQRDEWRWPFGRLPRQEPSPSLVGVNKNDVDVLDRAQWAPARFGAKPKQHTLANNTHALPIAIATPYGMVPVALPSATLPELRSVPFPGIAQLISNAATPFSPACI